MFNIFKCIMELKKENLFENAEHESRFHDLVNCYSKAPFFTAGLCKCMYLSSWDEDHFADMLDILNELTIGKDKNTEVMEDNGRVMEYTSEGHDAQIYQLSGAFLTGEKYELPDAPIDEEGRYIIQQAMKAADIIDSNFSGV